MSAREQLTDLVEDALDGVHDLDVPWSRYAEKVIESAFADPQLLLDALIEAEAIEVARTLDLPTASRRTLYRVAP